MADAVEASGSNAFIVSDEIYRELYYTTERPRIDFGILSAHNHRERLVKVDADDGLAHRLVGRRRRSDESRARTARLRRHLRFEHFAEGRAGGVDGMKRRLRALRCASIFLGRRDFLLQKLRDELGLRCVTPDGAFYTMVDVSEYGDELKVAEAGLEQGVVTIPAAAFGEESRGFLRISFCADEERLSEGVRRLGDALKTLT